MIDTGSTNIQLQSHCSLSCNIKIKPGLLSEKVMPSLETRLTASEVRSIFSGKAALDNVARLEEAEIQEKERRKGRKSNSRNVRKVKTSSSLQNP